MVRRRDPEIDKALGSTAAWPLGYQQCEWESGERCKYPGSMSTNTHAGGPYYCRLHFGCESAQLGAIIVEASRDYHHPTPEDIARTHAEGVRARLGPLGLLRQPDETVIAYRARTLEWMKSKATYRKMENA